MFEDIFLFPFFLLQSEDEFLEGRKERTLH